ACTLDCSCHAYPERRHHSAVYRELHRTRISVLPAQSGSPAAQSAIRIDAGGRAADIRIGGTVEPVTVAGVLRTLYCLAWRFADPVAPTAAAADLSHADQLHARAVARPRHRCIQPGAAHLRALRPVHGDLPDVPAAR